MPEHIGMDEAKDIVKKPRQGAVLRSFTRPRFFPEVDTREPEAKKSKRASAEDPGKESFYLSFYLFLITLSTYVGRNFRSILYFCDMVVLYIQAITSLSHNLRSGCKRDSTGTAHGEEIHPRGQHSRRSTLGSHSRPSIEAPLRSSIFLMHLGKALFSTELLQEICIHE